MGRLKGQNPSLKVKRGTWQRGYFRKRSFGERTPRDAEGTEIALSKTGLAEL